ncbi:MAG: EamA family transporter, partial [Bacteroidota bacterium]|nr:EamA family transporter [Bacteroidota bacterium]
MKSKIQNSSSVLLVIGAFGVVYLVWGSTYFFIQKAIGAFPPFALGAFRFLTAGLLLLIWCIFSMQKVGNRIQIVRAAVSGILMLFIGNGAVIWSERTIQSSLVAVLISAAPLWTVFLDKRNWGKNFKNPKVILGVFLGFTGVICLFTEQTAKALSGTRSLAQILSLGILLTGSISWSAGSLYSKYQSRGRTELTTAWQMLAAGITFLLTSICAKELHAFNLADVSGEAWGALIYLILMGSLLAYSAYVWLLKVRPATQVSTHSYVNPVVAVLIGIWFANESISSLQVAGLTVILI